MSDSSFTSARAAGAAHGDTAPIVQIIERHRDDLLAGWAAAQSTLGRAPASPAELRRQGEEFLGLLSTALAAGGDSLESRPFAPVRSFLEGLSRARALQGYSPSETATFVFALKGRCSSGCAPTPPTPPA